MNQNFATQLLDGSLKDYGTFLAGDYHGFHTAFHLSGGTGVLTVCADAENTDPGNANLSAKIAELKKQYKYLTATSKAEAHAVTLSITCASFGSGTIKRVNEVAGALFEYLVTNYYESGCSLCGTKEEVALYYNNGVGNYLCEACAAQEEERLINNKEEQSYKNSDLGKGLIGAIIGSLVGVAAWILLGQIGFIAGIAGVLMAIVGMKLYEKMGGCLDKKGVICCLVVMVVMIFFADYLSWAISFNIALKNNGYDSTLGYCFNNLFELLSYNGYTGNFIFNLLIGYALTAASGFARFKQVLAEAKGEFTFKKLG